MKLRDERCLWLVVPGRSRPDNKALESQRKEFRKIRAVVLPRES